MKQMNLSKQAMIVVLNNKFPDIDARDDSLFYGEKSDGIWFAGTESASIKEEFSITEADGTVMTEIFDAPILNMEMYMDTFGTHPKLESFLEDHGWYSEAYDAGTLMTYKI